MQDIAGRTGLGKGTLYLHFENKESLTIALVEHIFLSSEGDQAEPGRAIRMRSVAPRTLVKSR